MTRRELAFELLTPDGRVVAEAEDHASARYAAEVLYGELDEPRIDVRIVGERYRVGYVEAGPYGLMYVTTTLGRAQANARRYA